jgi:hypothetical protein
MTERKHAPAWIEQPDGSYIPFENLEDTTRAHLFEFMLHLRNMHATDPAAFAAVVHYASVTVASGTFRDDPDDDDHHDLDEDEGQSGS